MVIKKTSSKTKNHKEFNDKEVISTLCKLSDIPEGGSFIFGIKGRLLEIVNNRLAADKKVHNLSKIPITEEDINNLIHYLAVELSYDKQDVSIISEQFKNAIMNSNNQKLEHNPKKHAGDFTLLKEFLRQVVATLAPSHWQHKQTEKKIEQDANKLFKELRDSTTGNFTSYFMKHDMKKGAIYKTPDKEDIAEFANNTAYAIFKSVLENEVNIELANEIGKEIKQKYKHKFEQEIRKNGNFSEKQIKENVEHRIKNKIEERLEEEVIKRLEAAENKIKKLEKECTVVLTELTKEVSDNYRQWQEKGNSLEEIKGTARSEKIMEFMMDTSFGNAYKNHNKKLTLEEGSAASLFHNLLKETVKENINSPTQKAALETTNSKQRSNIRR